MLKDAIIRAFDGSLADAEGLLAVERATFDESPYSPEQVRDMLSDGAQRAWLALAAGRVVGFVAAFPTYGLRGPCWEIDLLAVHPDWTGRGLATRLIRSAANKGRAVARQARAVVAVDNAGSVQAFRRAGFRHAETCELFLLHPQGKSPHSLATSDVIVRQAETVGDAAPWLPGSALPTEVDGAFSYVVQQEQGCLTLLVAEWEGEPGGYAELIGVQTLLYRGIWIESLVGLGTRVCRALVNEAVNLAIAAGLDEVGMMLPVGEPSPKEALQAAGFRSLGHFHWFTAGLPLPGRTAGQSGGADD